MMAKMDRTNIFLPGYFMMATVILLIIYTLVRMNVDEVKQYQICQEKFQGYDIIPSWQSEVEPGYIKCCWFSYINHERVESCEIVKK